jgi:hypothetical protein
VSTRRTAPYSTTCAHCRTSIKKGDRAQLWGGWYVHPGCHNKYTAERQKREAAR